MATNYIKAGKSPDMIAPVGGVTSSTAFLMGGFFGVAGGSAAEGESFVLHTEGIWELPCLSTDVVAIGDTLYWDDDNSRLTTTSTDNTKVGIAYTAKAAAATAVQIKLLPGVGV
ncbi:DUF2190 family protein [uncultured Cohaesibacter sp.]|uniref:DUF2190 family protein n=1 Tax=uncultured Cohaesibacter sp. TaxID=1002546 RepID=UPI0029C82C64|nr:DUF2190 family protein [uncultured Cohaesibacter sp.]